eukprot:SAG31_NODE_34055_length_337_cov_0.689076_1_plen_57_part_10
MEFSRRYRNPTDGGRPTLTWSPPLAVVDRFLKVGKPLVPFDNFPMPTQKMPNIVTAF